MIGRGSARAVGVRPSGLVEVDSRGVSMRTRTADLRLNYRPEIFSYT
jgi:hypothetical protein